MYLRQEVSSRGGTKSGLERATENEPKRSRIEAFVKWSEIVIGRVFSQFENTWRTTANFARAVFFRAEVSIYPIL